MCLFITIFEISTQLSVQNTDSAALHSPGSDEVLYFPLTESSITQSRLLTSLALVIQLEHEAPAVHLPLVSSSIHPCCTSP